MPELTKRDAISYHLLVRWMHGPSNLGHATPCCCVHKRRNIRIGIGMENESLRLTCSLDTTVTIVYKDTYSTVPHRIVSSRQCAVGGPVRSCSRRITDHTSWIAHNSILIWTNNTTCVLYPDPTQPSQFVPRRIHGGRPRWLSRLLERLWMVDWCTIRALRRQEYHVSSPTRCTLSTT
jgi:hypothetical protein